MRGPAHTLHDAVANARQSLRAAGIPADEADLDARLLAQEVLGWDTARLMADGGEVVTAGFLAAFDALVSRRAEREPLAYIVGHREFWNLSFEVSPAVLIPRPETELLVEAALERLPPGEPARIADVCTGSGCVAVAVAHERPLVQVVATDLSAAAVDVARRNVARHGLADRIEVRHGDLLDSVTGTFTLVVSNPPYVSESEYAALQPEVRLHEPGAALVAGRDGLEAIRRLVSSTPSRLRPGGALLMEFGYGHAHAVRELISGTPGLRMVAVRPDLQGIPRIAIAERM
jgi:release factor glutamine methyltransferase